VAYLTFLPKEQPHLLDSARGTHHRFDRHL